MEAWGRYQEELLLRSQLENMIKSFFHLSLLLGVISGNLLMSPTMPPGTVGASLLGTQAAEALTLEEIQAKLRPVPVFTITDPSGSPLVATVPAGENGSGTAAVAGIFISRQDALRFVENLRNNNPELANSVEVTAVSLGEVYQMSQQSRNRADDIQFAYVPVQQEVESARAVMQQSGRSPNEFNGVPLFMAKGGPDNGYLTIQRGNDQVIPMFFSKQDLEGMLSQFREEQPDLISSVTVQVVPLEALLEAFRTDDNQFLDRIILVPPRETLEFLRNN
ncbi:Tic22 family protein [Limnospira platensis CENA597]|uniref:Tic22 family protein n=1 Tax=Limnospira platensis TaxID=118562 RepID=UPI003DA00BF9